VGPDRPAQVDACWGYGWGKATVDVDVTDYTLVAVAYQALTDLPAQSKPGQALTFPERDMLGRVRRCIAAAYEVTSHRSAPRLQRRRARKVLSPGQ
jgi:hypothetical protein